ncbi:MAG: phosphate/phosphite/phosphonate ABC transporter substrate-binding protein [Anaerolineae bacterium]
MGAAAILSPKATSSEYAALKSYLERELGMPVELVQRGTYAEINELLRTRQIDFAFVCTGAYVRGEREFGMEVLAVSVVGGSTTYRSYIIVPAESPAADPAGLRGKTFAFTDPLSLTGYIVPLMLFHSLGIQPEEFFQRTLFTYSHDNSIRAVAERWVDGAAVDSVIYDTMVQEDARSATATKIIWQSEPFGAPPVVVHPNLDPNLKERIRQVLLNMGDHPDGRAALAPLGVERFVLAGPELYESARQAMESVGGIQ